MSTVDYDMVQSPATAGGVHDLPICLNCKFWLQDTREPMTMSWGMCTVGLPPGTTMDSRQTPDMAQCSAFDKREAKA